MSGAFRRIQHFSDRFCFGEGLVPYLSNSLRSLAEIEQVSITLSLEKIVALMEADHLDAAPVLETGPLVGAKPEETEKN